ncbi:MAG TPA: glycosyltransferase [Pirellulaceae bacterium]|nr:glycosyltransferase [Pirellulaceae bacterium]
MAPLQIHHFCTYPHGGAAKAALRLHGALQTQGSASFFHYTLADRPAPEGRGIEQLEFAPSKRIPVWSAFGDRLRRNHTREIYRLYREHLERRPPHLETFSMAQQAEPTRLPPLFSSQAIAHLHWIAYLADYPTFFGTIPTAVPIVWTMHDMNPIIGGCHFSGGCDRFVVGCGNCPQVINPRPDDVSRVSYSVKQRALRHRQIHVVSPSRWLLRLAQQSPIWPNDTAFSLVRYGIDTNVFHPIDCRVARQQLGLDQSPVIIGFAADQLLNPRKGADFLWQALGMRDATPPVQLLVFGAGELPNSIEGVARVHHLGYMDNPQQQALAYSACDFVVMPSLEDNLPQVGIEALACATPVVGFDSGGLAELVLDGIHGLLAPAGDAAALSRALQWMIAHPDETAVMGQRGRLAMVREFDSAVQARKYLSIYSDELSQAQRRQRRSA